MPSAATAPAAKLAKKCKRPERILVGHPFNPPHIIPLVEVVGGTKTSPEALE